MRGPMTAATVLAVVLLLGGTGRASPPRPILCTLPAGAKTLPAGARRGLIQHMRKYPAVNLASPRQRARAAAIVAELVATSRREHWRDMRAIARLGYKTRTAVRKPGDRTIHYFHADHAKQRGGRFELDPSRPKALIFANQVGRPLVLVGAMWSMRRGEHGPTPGGPITRWHSHSVCVEGNKRGTKPLEGNRCPPGARLTQGTEMLHVWFTHDLRSAFSTTAPEPELCAARLLDSRYCARFTR